jgi:hypothetical protein
MFTSQVKWFSSCLHSSEHIFREFEMKHSIQEMPVRKIGGALAVGALLCATSSAQDSG